MQRLDKARSQQTQQASQDETTTECPPINKDKVWSQTVSSPYKGCIYGMGTYHNDALFLLHN